MKLISHVRPTVTGNPDWFTGQVHIDTIQGPGEDVDY